MLDGFASLLCLISKDKLQNLAKVPDTKTSALSLRKKQTCVVVGNSDGKHVSRWPFREPCNVIDSGSSRMFVSGSVVA